MTSFLVCGDPHIKTDNIPEVDMFINKLEKLIKDKQPDRIVILGDVLHTHERLHTIPLNKAYELINRVRQYTKTYVLVGNHDMCLGENVLVKTYAGGCKLSQDIKVGDRLQGDDYYPRTVKSVCSGEDALYKIKQYGDNVQDYVVNKNHILVLKKDYKTVHISVEEFLDLHETEQVKYFGYRHSVYEHYSHKLQYPISVQFVGIGKYYGFEVDHNNLFLLGDNTVTHNCNNQQYLSENHWMNAMKEWDNVEIVDTVQYEEIEGQMYIFSPYVPNGRFIEALETEDSIDWKKANIIFAHQEFKGCKMGAIVSEDGDEWQLEYPNVISGHIHSNQTPQKNVYYPGSAMQHAFGESEKNIIAYVDNIEYGDYNLEEIDLKLPRKKIIYTDVQAIDDVKLPKNEDKVKITVSGVYEEFKALKKTKKYKNLIDQGIKVVFKPKKLEVNSEKYSKTEVTQMSDFQEILGNIINTEKNPYLVEAYELIMSES